ncbi:MAG TPA: 2-oxo acid dehydrogenase subunit E2 [Propionibacterium sp.]|nr:2-oxo acid dehydrogenase subunit E2 [Propionibacterium sp.]
MFEMTLPDPGEGLLEAEITQWLVAPGDTVEVNQVVVEVETAKSLVELPAAVAGVVGELRAAEGDIVPVGSVIMTIETSEAEPVATPVNEPVETSVVEPVETGTPEPSGAVLVGYGTTDAPAARRARKGVPATPVPETDQVHESYGLDESPGHRTEAVHPTGKVDAEAHDPALPRPGAGRHSSGSGELAYATDPVGRPLAKPAVRRLARDLDVDLTTVAGTGPNGSITPTDVAQAAAGEASGRRGPTRIPLRGVRRQMMHAMQASLRVPQASVWMDVDVTNTVELIEQLKGRREFAGLRISPIIVLAKAVCLAMARHPEVNSSLDLERQEIVVNPDVNLGIAAATQRGLVVPNIKGAQNMNLLELAQALNDLVAKVREGRITPADAANGTFTITNVGVFGVEGGTPILNPNEAAILLLGTFNRRPWVVGEGEDERIEVRTIAKLTLTIDHRVLDGEQGSRFLADVATILADPGLSLLF